MVVAGCVAKLWGVFPACRSAGASVLQPKVGPQLEVGVVVVQVTIVARLPVAREGRALVGHIAGRLVVVLVSTVVHPGSPGPGRVVVLCANWWFLATPSRFVVGMLAHYEWLAGAGLAVRVCVLRPSVSRLSTAPADGRSVFKK